MRRVSTQCNLLFSPPAGPQTLGFCRMVVMLGSFLYYRRVDFQAWGYIRPHLLVTIPLFQHLRWSPLGPMAMWGLGFLWKGFLLVGGLGFFSRTCCALSFGLGLYLLGLSNSLGKIDHSDALLLWSYLIMAVGWSGDAWSIDRLIADARRATPSTVRSGSALQGRLHAEYRWPIRMMQVLMVVIFFCAGTTKLRYTGLHWAWSDNLRYTLLER